MPHGRKVARNRRRQGFTLTELAIVLGVICIVLSVIWLAAGAVWGNYKIYRLNQQISSLVRNVRDAYGPTGKPFGTGNRTAVLDAEGLIPSDMARGGVYSHAIGGGFTVSAVNCGVVPCFRLGLNNVARAECIKTLMEFPVLAPELGVGLIGTLAGSTTVNVKDVANPGSVPLPLTSAQAAAWCSSDTNNGVIVDFFIRN